MTTYRSRSRPDTDRENASIWYRKRPPVRSLPAGSRLTIGLSLRRQLLGSKICNGARISGFLEHRFRGAGGDCREAYQFVGPGRLALAAPWYGRMLPALFGLVFVPIENLVTPQKSDHHRASPRILRTDGDVGFALRTGLVAHVYVGPSVECHPANRERGRSCNNAGPRR